MFLEDDIYDDSPAQYLEALRRSKATRWASGPTILAYGLLVITVGYHMLQYFDYPVLPISELAWNMLVYLTPSRAISMLDPKMDGLSLGGSPADETLSSRHHALKSEAIRRIVGLDAGGILGKVQKAQSLPGVNRLLPGMKRNKENGSPPGLGNWDNSCYQNSVIQGLTSLQNLPTYLARSMFLRNSLSTVTALRTIIAKLNDPSNSGLMFWNPADLKTMNSWQQQDAQEYFSKVLDEVGKEIAAGQIETRSRAGGLASLPGWQESTAGMDRYRWTENPKSIDLKSSRSVRDIGQVSAELASTLTRSPLEGLIAQRVGCLKCGYVEGLSLVPFNCLTVPLGSQWMYDIRTCLDDYTALEPITGVECVKCTLLRNKLQLERLYTQTRDSTGDLDGSPLLTQALHASVKDRLSIVERALDANDFSDNAILKKCQIPANQRVSATKSRQAVVARAPKSLVIHVNRSVFDEATGTQRKNFAEVKYPLKLDLAPWCLGRQSSRNDLVEAMEEWSVDPSKSMHPLDTEDIASSKIDGVSLSNQMLYNLRAVITHYGRHENGHYMCYRKHRLGEKFSVKTPKENPETWWCFNDEEVSRASEETVLGQGDVFMLFYEKVELDEDVMPGSLEEVDPASLRSSSKSVGITSERKEVAADHCLRSETANTSHVTEIQNDAPVGATDNIHSRPLSKQHPISHQLSENPGLRTINEDTNDAASVSPPTSSTSVSSHNTFQESREAPLSDGSTEQQPETTPENSLINPSPENPSTVEPALAGFVPTQALPEYHLLTEPLPVNDTTSSESLPINDTISTESFPITDARNARSLDITISSTDETTKPLVLELEHEHEHEPEAEVDPEPGIAKLDEMLDKTSKLNPHHPMRTASPRSSRGSVSRAGKAMSNVSAMVIAN